jgi:hypothetical protein
MDIETVLQECKEEIDDLNRKCHDICAENEQYKSINDELQQSLEESAAGFEEELAALEGENTRLAEDNEEQKKEIEALERELRKKQFSSLSNHEANPLEDFDCSKESVADEEWAGVSQVVENLKEQNTTETKHMTDAEQTLVQRNENQMKMMQILEDKFHTLKASTEKREVYLLETIRRQKISIDSLYADLVCTKEQVTKLKEFAESPGQSNNGVDRSSSFTGDDDESKSSSKQADMLQSVMEKQSAKKQQQQQQGWRLFGSSTSDTSNKRASAASINGGDNTSLGDTNTTIDWEDKFNRIQEENLSLKSNLVQLQSQYKDALYKHKRTVEELQLANDAILLKNMALSEAIHGAARAEPTSSSSDPLDKNDRRDEGTGSLKSNDDEVVEVATNDGDEK